MIEARDKTGMLICRDALLDFFATTPAPGPLGTRTFDPKVVYDQFEDRFLVVDLERVDAGANPSVGNMSRILLAVSNDGTPGCAATNWDFLAIDSETSISGLDHFADYPGFEVDEEAIYITNNMFQHDPLGDFGGVRLWIVAKGAGTGGFYDGGAAAVTFHDPYAGGGLATTTMPAQVFGAGGVGPGIGTFLVSYSGLTNGIDEFVQVVRVDAPLGAVSFAQEFINIGDTESFAPVALPDAPQSGTATLIEVTDRRALDAVWRDGNLYLTTTINPNSGPDTGQATAHWFQLDTSAAPGGAITSIDQGNIGGEDIATDTTTFYPSVAVNNALEVKFGFSVSAASIFAGAFVTGRQPGDPPGTVQGSQTVKAGEDFYIRTFGGPENRWGDYSGISVDPTDQSFWVFNEFADTRETPTPPSGEEGRWGTAWLNCSFSPPVNVLQDCWTTNLTLNPDAELELYTFTTADSIDFIWKQKLQETCSAYLASIWVFECIAGKPLPGPIVQVFHDIDLGQQDPMPGVPEPLFTFTAAPGAIPPGRYDWAMITECDDTNGRIAGAPVPDSDIDDSCGVNVGILPVFPGPVILGPEPVELFDADPGGSPPGRGPGEEGTTRPWCFDVTGVI